MNEPTSTSASSYLPLLLTHGVLVEVIDIEQAKRAETCGASGIIITTPDSEEISQNTMPDPLLIQKIQRKTNIPLGAKIRKGHTIEAQILDSLSLDFIYESTSPSLSQTNNIFDTTSFITPFVCEVTNISEAIEQRQEGATIVVLTATDENENENISNTITNQKELIHTLSELIHASPFEKENFAKEMNISISAIQNISDTDSFLKRLFIRANISTPSDAAFIRSIGGNGLVLSSDIFHEENHEIRIQSIIQASVFYKNPEKLLQLSSGLEKRGRENNDI